MGILLNGSFAHESSGVISLVLTDVIQRKSYVIVNSQVFDFLDPKWFPGSVLVNLLFLIVCTS